MWEAIFWLVLISIAIFLNLSPQVFKQTQPLIIIAFLIPFLAIILAKTWHYLRSSPKKSLILLACFLIIFIPSTLIVTNFANLVTFYYLPALIALVMAFLIILEPRVHEIMLVGLSLFFLGEAFFGIQAGNGGGIKYPLTFFRMYTLTLLIIFVYYLYNKEAAMRKELSELNTKLKEYDELKSDFIADVSHELRTPLTSIKNATVLLKERRDKPEGNISISDEELLNILIANIDKQYYLVDALLNLARIEKGEVVVCRSLVDLEKTARGEIMSLGTQTASKNIEIILDAQPDLPKIYASEKQIAQVYVNLLDNAIKYSKAGDKIFLRISVDDNNNVKSTVEDTGKGIAPENLEKIFNRFGHFVVPADKDTGVGLGLVITKAIVESHGGKIWAESKLGVGSKFIFTLPPGLRRGDRRRAR
jgi:signal transduction histidine kinase